MPEPATATAVSFEVDADDADAIGAMILGQDRPAMASTEATGASRCEAQRLA